MRIRELTLQEALALLPYTTGLSATISIALVAFKAWRQPAFPYVGTVIGIAAGALLVAVVVALLVRLRPLASPRWLNAGGATSWALGLQLGVLLLTVPVFALVKGVAADDVQWTWTYLNKRWLVALYSLMFGTVGVFPVLCEWWRASPVTPRRVPLFLARA